MSLQVATVVSPVLTLDEPGRLEQAPTFKLPTHEPPTQDPCLLLTCRDVIEGVHQRLADKGCRWD